MLAYKYDKNAAYYLGEVTCQLDPLATKQSGEAVYLVPPCATLTKPNLKKGYWVKWSGSEWQSEKIPTTCEEAIKAKLTCISNSPNPHDQEVKALLEALAKGDTEHYRIKIDADMVMSLESIPEQTLDELKAIKLTELSGIASAFEHNVCKAMVIKSSLGFRADADRRTRDNIRGLIELGQAPVPYRTADNESRLLTIDNLRTLLNEITQNGTNLYLQKWQKEAAINAATTTDELNAVDLTFTMMSF